VRFRGIADSLLFGAHPPLAPFSVKIKHMGGYEA
jgi:hypothetical protein